MPTPLPTTEPTQALLRTTQPLTPTEQTTIDASVHWLRQVALRHGIDHAIEVRDHILATYFGGDYAAFADPSRTKPNSFAALCRRDDLPYKYSTLNFLVRIGQQVDELPPGLGRELGPSHHRALLPVADVAAKEDLARKAIKDDLSVAELEALVRSRKPPTRAGRPKLPSVIKRGHALRRALASFEDADIAEVAELGAAQRDELSQAVAEAAARLQGLLAALQSEAPGSGL